MERKKKVPMGEGFVDATIIDINSSQENWNQYLLADGSLLKLKAVATEVVRLDNQYDNDGNPMYMVKSANILSVLPSDNLKKQSQ